MPGKMRARREKSRKGGGRERNTLSQHPSGGRLPQDLIITVVKKKKLGAGEASGTVSSRSESLKLGGDDPDSDEVVGESL